MKRIVFSLRTLFVILTLTAGIAWVAGRIELQRQHVRQIEASHVVVSYPHQGTNECLNDGGSLPFAIHLARFFGPDVVSRPNTIYVHPIDPTVPKPDYERILKHANSLGTIRRVHASESGVSNSELALLSGIQSLECVTLYRTMITDEGVQHLPKMPRLRILSLRETGITDASAECLASCKHLESLDVALTLIGDLTVMKMKTLPRLRVLRLSDTDVSDGAIPILSTMGSLERLAIYRTKITLEGYRELCDALPNTTIDYDWEHDFQTSEESAQIRVKQTE